MRKQNSDFHAAFLSEAGSELENNDYFAFVELDKYACYVLADGLNEQPDIESARLVIETILLAFQEKPSLKRAALYSYLKAANEALLKDKSRKRLKASVVVVVTDYISIRYGCVGNTRLRLYREGALKEKSKDMSLAADMTIREEIPRDALTRHKERNNLYTWVGQKKGYSPFISKKIKLTDGDILNLYTRGIWENLDEGELEDVFREAKAEPQECLNNLEDMILSKQPEELTNYTFVTVFINKVFVDPNRKRRIRKIIITVLATLVIVLIIALMIWLVLSRREKKKEELEHKIALTMEYIADENFVRANEACTVALELAENLRDKKQQEELTQYQLLVEAINKADNLYDTQDYELAQKDYLRAKERSRKANGVADRYIEQRLETIADYLAVFDAIQLGDSLYEKGDYTKAEEKYLEAKKLATGIYFTEGRKEAIDSLDKLYVDMAAREEEVQAAVQEAAAEEAGAAELISKGDQAFAEGDIEGAKIYYAMAIDKYRKMDDLVQMELAETKLRACVKKANEQEEQEAIAETYVAEAERLKEEKNFEEARKNYLLAKDIYEDLQKDKKVSQMENYIDKLQIDVEKEQKKQEELEKEEQQLKEQQQKQTVSGNAVG